MQVVHVLRAEKIAAPFSRFELRFKLGERDVSGVGVGFLALCTSSGVERPDASRIALPGIGRAHVFDAKAGPETIFCAEGGQSAFGTDARAGEDEDAVCGVD